MLGSIKEVIFEEERLGTGADLSASLLAPPIHPGFERAGDLSGAPDSEEEKAGIERQLEALTEEYVRHCGKSPKFNAATAERTIEVGDHLVQLAGGWLPAVRRFRA
jgi:hypothetical protein